MSRLLSYADRLDAQASPSSTAPTHRSVLSDSWSGEKPGRKSSMIWIDNDKPPHLTTAMTAEVSALYSRSCQESGVWIGVAAITYNFN
jgi:hypothetical protein